MIIKAANKISELFNYLEKRILSLFYNLVNKILKKPHLFFVIPAVIMLIRGGKHLFFRPQLYAEDGVIWMADAYSMGAKSITSWYQWSAQYHTAERVFAYLSAKILPLEWQPFIYSLAAYLIFVLMCYFLLDKKNHIVKSSRQALILAFMLGLIQNIEEMAFNFSNAVFYLGIIGVILICKNYNSVVKNTFKYILYGIISTTLPFSIFYMPIALFRFIKNKKLDESIMLLISFCGTVLQVFALIQTRIPKPPVILEGNILQYFKHFIVLIFNQIVAPSLLFIFPEVNPLQLSTIIISLIPLSIAFYLLLKYFVLELLSKNYKYLSLMIFNISITLSTLYRILINYGGSILGNIKGGSISLHGGDRYYLFAIIMLYIVVSFFLSNIPSKFRPVYLPLFISILIILISGERFFIVRPDYIDYTNEYKKAVIIYNNTGVFSAPTSPKGWGIYFKGDN